MIAGTRETGTVLDRIVRQTAADLEHRKQAVPPAVLQDRIDVTRPPLSLATAIDGDAVAVIAEIKKASPSKGAFPVDVDVANVASAYVTGGAAAVSCLTDEPFFRGSLDDLHAVAERAHAAAPPVVVLRKDFMIDPYQITEARAYGADCILLIVAALDHATLTNLLGEARDLELSVIVEVHDSEELHRALDAGADIIGINNRDLKTMTVDLETTVSLTAEIPDGVRVIGESGIVTRGHVQTLATAGVHAVLVGESLIMQEDRAAAVRALKGVPRV